MGAKKYIVKLASEITPLIESNLKNYGQNPSGIFIQDTVDTLQHVTRLDNGADYVILKVSVTTPLPAIQAVIPGFGTGPDAFNRLHNDKQTFKTFLTQNFVQ